MKKVEVIIDVISGEETIIEREETAEETAEREAAEAELATRQVEAQARAEAKAQVLAQLGITEEQAKLLLS